MKSSGNLYQNQDAKSNRTSSKTSRRNFWCFRKPKKSLLVTASSSQSSSTLTSSYNFPEYDQNKKVLVLDLDETLVKVSLKPPQAPHSIIELTTEGEFYELYVVRRPGLDEFIEEMGKIYNLCIYTSGDKLYAASVLKEIGILNKMCAVYSRKFTYAMSETVHIKKLSILGYPPDKMIFIDDFPLQMKYQPHNGILLREFQGDIHDKELKNLIPFLRHMNQFDDVRPVSRHLFDFYSKTDIQCKHDILLRNLDDPAGQHIVASERKGIEKINTLISLEDPMLRMKGKLSSLSDNHFTEHCDTGCSIYLRMPDVSLKRLNSDIQENKDQVDDIFEVSPAALKKVISAPFDFQPNNEISMFSRRNPMD